MVPQGPPDLFSSTIISSNVQSMSLKQYAGSLVFKINAV